MEHITNTTRQGRIISLSKRQGRTKSGISTDTYSPVPQGQVRDLFQMGVTIHTIELS